MKTNHFNAPCADTFKVRTPVCVGIYALDRVKPSRERTTGAPLAAMCHRSALPPVVFLGSGLLLRFPPPVAPSGAAPTGAAHRRLATRG
jgi:hypothetical protein